MSRGGSIKKDLATGGYYFVVDISRAGEPRKQLNEQWVPVLRTQVRASTAHSYERNLRLHVIPHLGSKPLQSVRPADLTTLYARLLSDGRRDHLGRATGAELSLRSVAYLHTILGKCLGDAVDGGLLKVNPARRAKVPKPASAATGTTSSAPGHAKSRRTSSPPLEGIATTLPGCCWPPHGLRRGEALGLSWSALDLDASRLRVARTLVDVDRGRPVWSDPKTRRGRRSIALDAGTVAALGIVRAEQEVERRAAGERYVDHDLVFARPDGSPIHPDRLARSFIEQGEGLGLPAIRLHDLRHTWATLALEAGVHPEVVSERLGHSTISITLDIYSHVSPAMQTDAAAQRVATTSVTGR